LLGTARRLLRHRGLLATLVGRELKGRYRGSALGFLWSLVQPLLLLAVYSFVFGLVMRPRAGGVEPYPLFVVCGLFPWIWFATALQEGTVALTAGAGLIRRAVFPVELLPVVPVLANLVHLLLALPIVGVALVVGRWQGATVGGWGALALPAVLALELPLVAGLALGLAALHAHFKDVRDLLGSVLTLLFFLTPVIYPLEALDGLPKLGWLVRLSPATPFTLAYQRALFDGAWPEPELWTAMAAASLVGWALGAWIFGRLRETLVEAV
jgi:ABC-2 type transport system permease protein/lipopolysaccharide transport system permease protein